jgi:putative GTP pyrophosphokinase
MSESKKPPDAKAADIDAVLAEFDRRRDILAAFCAKTKSLIEESLQDGKIRYQSVQARVKTKKKLREKYLDPKKGYKRLDDITDLAGLRIITYYEDEIDQVAEIIKREFEIIPKDSIDKRKTEPDRFGYYALQYVCRHSPSRRKDVEYKKFADVCCEIQLTSVLRHAWAEIEHEWYDLKDAYPVLIKRRFSRMAALLEIAESEFLDIRKKRLDYERSIAVQVEANVSELQLDAVSLKSFMEQDSIVARIDRSIADLFDRQMSDNVDEGRVEWRSKELDLVGLTTVQALRDALNRYETALLEYLHRCKKIWPIEPSPDPRKINKGVCIHHLAMMLLGARSETELSRVLTELGAPPGEFISKQAAAARDVVAKYAL